MVRIWDGLRPKRPKLAGCMTSTGTKIRTCVPHWLPPLNYITLHYTYIISLSLAWALIFWGSSTPAKSTSFLDSLFSVTSAITSTGFNVVVVSKLTTFQQVILFISSIMGSPILISAFTLAFRKHVFERRFQDIVRRHREGHHHWHRHMTRSASEDLASTQHSFIRRRGNDAGTHSDGVQPELQLEPKPLGGGDTMDRRSPSRSGYAPVLGGEVTDPEKGPGHLPDPYGGHHINHQFLNPGDRNVSFLEPTRTDLQDSNTPTTTAPYLQPAEESPQHDDAQNEQKEKKFSFKSFLHPARRTIGRNAQFFNLTASEREYLGGVEYRALKILMFTVIAYLILWQFLGALALGAWLSTDSPEISLVNAQNPWWSGIFLSISHFNGIGYVLWDAGMVSLADKVYPLLTSSLLIAAGSPLYPAFLRLIIWTMSRALRWLQRAGYDSHEIELWRETLDFILRYPRRVYTHLFDARATLQLVGWIGTLLAVGWVGILVLSIGNPVVWDIAPGQRVIDALYQADAGVYGGFAVFSMSGLYFSVQVLLMVIIYLAAYPELITLRSSNVYEERSLGIYRSDLKSREEPAHPEDEANEEAAQAAAASLFRSPQPELISPRSARSHMSRLSLNRTRTARTMTTIGRGGQAILNRLQRRVTNFNGVGVPITPTHASGSNEEESNTNTRLPSMGMPPAPSSASSTTLSHGGHHHQEGMSSRGRPPFVRAQSEPELPSQQQLPQAVHNSDAQLRSHQVRSQLSHDMWFLVLAVWLICLIETSHSQARPVVFSVFNIMFEVVSAYACNGLSMGLPGTALCFGGGFYAGSKVIIVIVMWRGRHRNLPVVLDRAVRLPAEDLDLAEEEDAEIRRGMAAGGAAGADGRLGLSRMGTRLDGGLSAAVSREGGLSRLGSRQ